MSHHGKGGEKLHKMFLDVRRMITEAIILIEENPEDTDYGIIELQGIIAYMEDFMGRMPR